MSNMFIAAPQPVAAPTFSTQQPFSQITSSTALSPSHWVKWYKYEFLRHKIPSSRVIVHLMFAVGAVGFVTHYGKNSAHLFSKHH
jgi:hypothetical protein